MKAYSEDLRKKIVEAVEREMSKTMAAKTFGVSRSSVKRYAGAAREGKPLTPKQHPGSKPKLDERARRLVEADVEQRPAASLKERCRFVRRVVGVSGLWIERYDGSRSRQEPPPRRLRCSKASTASVGNGFEK